MINLIYFGLMVIIAIFDSLFKGESFYTIVNIALRVCIILPLIFCIVKGTSEYAKTLRKTLWVVIVADVLLPVYFPLGMVAFLVVHVLNIYNFSQYIEVNRGFEMSVIVPGIVALSVSLSLYLFVLFPSMDAVFRVLVGVYLFPITLAWSFSITNYVQNRTRWALITSTGMFLFFFTDFQVAVEFLTSVEIPYYGVVNACTYYLGLFLMSQSDLMEA
ncbi:MAG: lysoplasmalogenase family protein [Myxococcota bacterium]